MKKQTVVVTGGAGYCGSRLVPQLLGDGYKVRVFDVMYFGNDFLPKQHSNLEIIKGDIRDTKKLKEVFDGSDSVVHLACISNDASFELNERLSTTVNLDAFEPMVLAAKTLGVQRFIYASSSSVYGVSDKPDVTEDHELVPLTLYNKYKGMCEPLLLKHLDDNFTGVILRPATVCGYAPRQRLDLTVNILTNLAVNKRHITVFGGDQLRPNLHIQDYCDVVKLMLTSNPKGIQGQTFNVGYENLTINQIAEIVKKIVENRFPGPEIEIVKTKSDDNRSYHINSDKIQKVLGFKPKLSVADAIEELCSAFRENKLPNSLEDDRYFNVKRLTRLGVN